MHNIISCRSWEVTSAKSQDLRPFFLDVVLLKWFDDKFLNLDFDVSAVTERGLGNLLCSMEKEDLKILNKGGEEEMVYTSVFYAIA